MHAFIELAYQRHEDDAGVTLVATLPTVRALTIGGSASELRLPGLPPDAALARISFAHSHFFLENMPLAENAARDYPLAVNAQPLSDGVTELDDGDAITIGRYELRFHAGEPPRDPPLIDTPLRWKLPATVFERPYEVAPDDPSGAYIEEFMLAARPHVQAERFADVRRLAETELRRVKRAEEPGALERYCRFLWTTRLKMARLSNDVDFAALTREALDLYPDDSTLLVTVGINQLKQRDWIAAARTFEHAIAVGTFENFQSRHDARLGRIVSRHLLSGGAAAAEARAPAAWGDDWDVPELRLDAPGDELLLWRVCHYGEVFGPAEQLRYGYCGEEEGGADGYDAQRWEIRDVRRGVAFRRIVRYPSLLRADPSLIVEIAAFRDALEKFDREWMRLIVDRTGESRAAPPLQLDAGAIRALRARRGGGVPRLSLEMRPSGARCRMDILAAPQPGDVVIVQDSVSLAVAAADVANLTGATLVHLPGAIGRYYLSLPERGLARVHVPMRRESKIRIGILAGLIVAVAAVAIAFRL
ncbi:MAG: hypothetical protein HRU75_03510 [Planctomycetia bacterium]|nr:MAG: hypothetical protein HRU75_03510 [Planctomycetia bacterium]